MQTTEIVIDREQPAVAPSSTHPEPKRGIRGLPPVRGSLPMAKLRATDNFELVAMRHMEFRRAPNPAPARLERFRPIAERAAGRFLGVNRALCGLHGFEFGDLMTYSLVWTINFLGLYAKGENGADSAENEKLLTAYLKQLAEFRKLVFRKVRDCFPLADVVDRELPIAATDYADADVVDDGYASRHCELDLRSDGRRRRSATELLERSMASLSHGALIEALRHVESSEHADYGARREARERLRRHRAHCANCTPS